MSKDTQSAHFNSTYISYSTTALHPSMKAFLYLYLKHGWFYFCLALRKKFPRVEDKGSLLDVTFERVSASKSFGQFWANFSLAQSHQLFVFGIWNALWTSEIELGKAIRLSGFYLTLGKVTWKDEIDLDKATIRGSQLCKSVCNADSSTGLCKEGTRYPPFKMHPCQSSLDLLLLGGSVMVWNLYSAGVFLQRVFLQSIPGLSIFWDLRVYFVYSYKTY